MPEEIPPAEMLERARHAAEIVEKGSSKIHRHEKFSEIVELLATNALLPGNKKIQDTMMVRLLAEEYSITVTKPELAEWKNRYILPALYIAPEFVKRGIFDAGLELNTARRKLELAQMAWDDLQNNPISEDVTMSERAAMIRAASQTLNDAEEVMERFRIIPPKKIETQHVEVQVDFAAVMDKMRKQPPTIDVTPKPKEPDLHPQPST